MGEFPILGMCGYPAIYGNAVRQGRDGTEISLEARGQGSEGGQSDGYVPEYKYDLKDSRRGRHPKYIVNGYSLDDVRLRG